MAWFYALISVAAVSLISLVGVFTLPVKREKMEKILIYLVSLSAGTLLGDVFIHLIPEAYGFDVDPVSISLFILGGILFFFVLEKFIHWHHCHKVVCEKHPHPFSYTVLAGDSVHNFIDGMIIGASYLVSVPVGIATTIAVIFHEIPQEIGNFGSLVYGGFSRVKALFLNFVSALTAVAGVVLVLILGVNADSLINFLIPFAAGGFIYIASSDLIPELHKDTRLTRSAIQLATFAAGIAIMFILTFLEK